MELVIIVNISVIIIIVALFIGAWYNEQRVKYYLTTDFSQYITKGVNGVTNIDIGKMNHAQALAALQLVKEHKL